jgi:hypothetical protein
MDNMVQFRIRQRYAVWTWLLQTETTTTNNNNNNNSSNNDYAGQECDVSCITCTLMDLGGRLVVPQHVVHKEWMGNIYIVFRRVRIIIQVIGSIKNESDDNVHQHWAVRL